LKGGTMTGKTRSSLLSFAIIAVLLFGALSPTTAYADDGTPPDTPPTEAPVDPTGPAPETTAEPISTSDEVPAEPTDSAPEATAEPTGTPDEATPEPTDPAPEATAEPTGTPDEVPAEPTDSAPEATAEPTDTSSETSAEDVEASTPPPTEETAPVAEETASLPDASILDEIPDNTDVVVLDAEGQSQSLATQDAADAIAEKDPIWCPQGQDPTPGANGCTPSFNSFKALLTFLSGNASYQGAGTIYIQAGVFVTGGQNNFNSPDYDLSNIRDYDLTLTGGWDPATNTVDPASTSTFRVPFLIGTSANPWGGSIIINNITIDKSDGTSLVLYSQEDIRLSNVNITNAHNNGAGADLNAGGNVTINNSNFNRNKTAGAIIRAGRNIAIANSSFSNPTAGRQQITGLDIVNGGTVALLNVTVNNNREAGANINSAGRVTISNGFFSGTKAFQGSGASRVFVGYGLQVVTPDAIDLINVEANDNFLWGASLQAGGDVAIRDAFFNANTTESPGFIDDTGLLITSGGSVALNNVQANDNRLIGASIDAVGDVAIRDSTFSNNNGMLISSGGAPTFYGYGLQVFSQGDIALFLVTASDNMLFGAHLDAGGNVRVSSSSFNNQTSGSTTDQTGRGLEVISAGNIVLDNVVIDNNQTFGADLQAGGDIFLDSVTATNNGLDGVDAQGSCTAVFLGDGTYSNNGQYGLSVTNAVLNQSGTAVFANNGAGDIFEDPGSCVFNTPITNNTGSALTGSGNSAGSVPMSAALTANPVQGTLQQRNSFYSGTVSFIPATGIVSTHATSNRFVAITGTTSGVVQLTLFTGQYAYMYSDSGVLHIITFSPSSNSLAMDGLTIVPNDKAVKISFNVTLQ
jgi:hypothetical protein